MSRRSVLPANLLVLCTSIAFERAAYFGLQSLLALYLATVLTNTEATSRIWLLTELANFSGTEGMALAAVVTGLFVSLAAVAPVIGGIVADRLIGQHRAILAGGTMMAAGHGLLVIQALLLPALATIALGSGFGRVRQCGVESGMASGRHFQAAFGVICSG